MTRPMLPRPWCLLVATCLLASVPPAQTTVIFLGADSGADKAIQTYLEGRYGKTNVTFQTTEPVGTVKASTILGFDVAVLSSTPFSGRYRNILHDSPTPIVNLEEAVADDVPAFVRGWLAREHPDVRTDGPPFAGDGAGQRSEEMAIVPRPG